MIGPPSLWVDLHTIALKVNELLDWGSNQNGSLGHGGTTDRVTPTQVGTETDWSQVAAGYARSFAIKKTNGTLWGWRNTTGR